MPRLIRTLQLSPTLITGNATVDAQHQALYDVANIFFSKEYPGQRFLSKNLTFLKAYVQLHFDQEERLMEAFRYTWMRRHIDWHVRFIQEVQALEEVAKDGEALHSLTARLHVLFSDWFTYHIHAQDVPMAEFIRKRLAKVHTVPEQASSNTVVEQTESLPEVEIIYSDDNSGEWRLARANQSRVGEPKE